MEHLANDNDDDRLKIEELLADYDDWPPAAKLVMSVIYKQMDRAAEATTKALAMATDSAQEYDASIARTEEARKLLAVAMATDKLAYRRGFRLGVFVGAGAVTVIAAGGLVGLLLGSLV